MYSTTDFRKGLKIELNGEPFIMVDFQHVKPGKGVAFVKTRLKSLLTGRILDKTFRSGEKVVKADTEEREMQFLYKEGDKFCFMDNETYEQVFISEDKLGNKKFFLKENINAEVLFYKENPIGVELPIFVELKITKTEPGLRGDTTGSATKPATLESGAVIAVPLFINEGDIIKIDTRTGEYVERVEAQSTAPP